MRRQCKIIKRSWRIKLTIWILKEQYCKRLDISGRHWRKHSLIWIRRRLEQLNHRNWECILIIGVCFWVKTNSKYSLTSLIMIRMGRYHMKTFKILLAWKSIQWNFYISDKTTQKHQSQWIANMISVGKHLLDVQTIAVFIWRCLRESDIVDYRIDEEDYWLESIHS